MFENMRPNRGTFRRSLVLRTQRASMLLELMSRLLPSRD